MYIVRKFEKEKEDKTMNNTRILYGNTLLYKGVNLINIDRSYDALYWCCRHCMEKTDSVILKSGEKLDIYRNDKRGLACAIPV